MALRVASARHNGCWMTLAMKITETRLRRAFFDVLTALLATAATTTAAGCGGGGGDIGSSGASSSGGSSSSSSSSGGSSSGGSSGTTGEFQTLCASGALVSNKTFLQGLQASPPVDGVVQRTESAFKLLSSPPGSGSGGNVQNPDDGDDGWVARDGETAGTLCAKATNQGLCQEKVKGYRVLPPTRAECNAQYGTGQGYDGNTCSATYYLYTRGDEVGVARTKEETKALIGSFDTFEEVMWAVNGAGYSLSCSSTRNGGVDSAFRRTADNGWDVKVLQYENCGTTTFAVTLHVDASGNITETSREDLNVKPSCAVAGRRPDGLCLDPIMLATEARKSSPGEHFAAMATLEAASVTAFRRLHRQLAAFGAPKELLARIRKAARDEIRHARATTKLAKKYGVTPETPRISAPATSPSLLTIALENAREGCVRETYGALVAHLQITRAEDADVRACMEAIAGEETEHAALSWDIAAWIDSELDETGRARVAAERRKAFFSLFEELACDVPNDQVRAIAGVPSRDEAVKMLKGLEPILLAA